MTAFSIRWQKQPQDEVHFQEGPFPLLTGLISCPPLHESFSLCQPRGTIPSVLHWTFTGVTSAPDEEVAVSIAIPRIIVWIPALNFVYLFVTVWAGR